MYLAVQGRNGILLDYYLVYFYVIIYKQLQSIGLVEPVDAPFMYFAAMDGKGCKLTALGKHYWRLVKNNNI